MIIMLSFYRVVVGYKDAMVFNHNLSARYSIIINSKNKENVYVRICQNHYMTWVWSEGSSSNKNFQAQAKQARGQSQVMKKR